MLLASVFLHSYAVKKIRSISTHTTGTAALRANVGSSILNAAQNVPISLWLQTVRGFVGGFYLHLSKSVLYSPQYFSKDAPQVNDRLTTGLRTCVEFVKHEDLHQVVNIHPGA